MQKTYRDWTKSEINFIVKNYKTVKAAVIAKKLKRTRSSIISKANKLYLKSDISSKRKIYAVEDKFFSKPNLLNSYWAGFIAADGNLHKTRKLLEISLNKKDKKHLVKFKKNISFTGPINFNKTDDCNRVAISSETIYSDLQKNFNIVPKKSLILKPPRGLTLTQSLSFIAGYIDGDGCIWYRNNNKNNIVVEILGTEKMMKWIKYIFKNKLKYTKSIYISKKQNIYKLRFTSNEIKTYLKYIKNLELPLLDRKWGKI